MRVLDDKRFIRTFVRDVCGELVPQAELHLWSLEVRDNHNVLMRRGDAILVHIVPASPFHGFCCLGMVPIQDRSSTSPRAQELISRFVAKHKLRRITQFKREA